MSVMILKKECFDRIYKGLAMRGMDKKMAEKLVKMLANENVETFNRRYEGENATNDYKETEQFDSIAPPVIHQIISDLDAVRYNVDDNAILKELTTLIDSLEDTHEYKMNRYFDDFIVY